MFLFLEAIYKEDESRIKKKADISKHEGDIIMLKGMCGGETDKENFPPTCGS